MIDIEFTAEQIGTLEYERYHYPNPKIQKKLEVIYLKSQGLQHQDICRICRICKTTLVSYLRQYQGGDLERLKETHYVGQANELQEHKPHSSHTSRLTHRKAVLRRRLRLRK